MWSFADLRPAKERPKIHLSAFTSSDLGDRDNRHQEQTIQKYCINICYYCKIKDKNENPVIATVQFCTKVIDNLAIDVESLKNECHVTVILRLSCAELLCSLLLNR